MEYVNGSRLPANLQKQAKAQFVHRFTGEHVPAWSQEKAHGNGVGGCAPMTGKHYPVQFRDDADWLANTIFAVTKVGTLAQRKDCASTPTWPQTKAWRDTPFRRGEL